MKVLTLSPANSDISRESPVMAVWHKEKLLVFPFLAAILGLKLALALLIWRNGYLEYDADGFTRSFRAWQWHAGQTKLEVDAWLPLQFWLNGWLMNFWSDLLHLPRAVNMLCSIGTTVNFFFIGRNLFGRFNGYLAALLAAIFPWEIWFGMSGMSESLTHFFLSLGVLFFTRWLAGSVPRPLWLFLSSLGFMGATMVRYEAWFYSAVYAFIVVFITWKRRPKLEWTVWVRTVLALLPAFGFILYWMAVSWMDPRLNSPLGFAKLTSDINARIYGSENGNASFIYKLFFYPQTFFNLFLALTIPAILGSLWLAFRPVGPIRFYLGLIWGEFALFILTTLPYNNLAPGSARYPVSNLLLLLPVVAYLFQVAFLKYQSWLRLVVVGLFLALLVSMAVATLSRPKDFPDGYTRQVAQWLEDRWDEGYIKPGEKVILNIPAVDGPRAGDFVRAYYALIVLTNHPDGFTTEASPENFGTMVFNVKGYAPHLWVHLDSAGGDLNSIGWNYREVKKIGDYTVARFPNFRMASASPGNLVVGQQVVLQTDEHKSKETVTAWVTRADGSIDNLGNLRADDKGVVTINYTVKENLPGTWSVTIAGMESGRRSFGSFEVAGP